MKMTTCLILAGLTVVSVSGPLRAGEGGKVDILVTKNKHIDFVIGDKLAGRYHIAPTVAKPYFWPLNAPGEVPVTRAWPMEKGKPGESVDHKHQKSAWFCHGDVIPEGMELKIKVKGVTGVDFWSEAEGHGKIVCTEVGGSSGREGQARVTTKNEWRTADGTKILDETRTLRLYDLRKARLFVLDIDLHASVVPITFGDTKEGAMGVRVNDTIREQKGNGQMRNAEG